MDYTTMALVKEALHVKENADDALINRLVAAASRAADRICTGSVEAVDYFKQEAVTDEMIRGIIGLDGKLLCWPRKSRINSVASLSWRTTPMAEWIAVDANRLAVDTPRIEAYLTVRNRGEVLVKISYNGGHAATVAALPADFIELVSMIAGRYYREDESGMTDAVGIAELGTINYTKSLPVRVRDMIIPYLRRVRW